MKTEYWMSFISKTAGEGPFMFGFAVNADATLVEAAIEGDPQDSSSPVNADTKFPVWPLEMISETDTETGNSEHCHKGKFTPRWSNIEGKNAVWWVYNMDGVAATTGTLVRVFAKHYGVWLRD